MAKLSRDMDDLHEAVRSVALIGLERHPNVFISETGRTIEQQKENIKNGVSWTMDSKHLMNPKSTAFDIGYRGDELYPKDDKEWQPFRATMEALGMVCGYTLWGKDKMHFQATDKLLNKENMKDKYVDMEEAIGVLTALTGDGYLKEKEVKALVNVGCNRIKDQITQDVIKEIILLLTKK